MYLLLTPLCYIYWKMLKNSVTHSCTHCGKRVCIQSHSDPAFRLNTDQDNFEYGHLLHSDLHVRFICPADTRRHVCHSFGFEILKNYSQLTLMLDIIENKIYHNTWNAVYLQRVNWCWNEKHAWILTLESIILICITLGRWIFCCMKPTKTLSDLNVITLPVLLYLTHTPPVFLLVFNHVWAFDFLPTKLQGFRKSPKSTSTKPQTTKFHWQETRNIYKVIVSHWSQCHNIFYPVKI